MGDLTKARKKLPENLYNPRLRYDYESRPTGTVAPDPNRQPFRWVSEVAYKNLRRIVARGYDTTELVERGYGLADLLFVDYQSRIPLVEENQMLQYLMILSLEDGLSSPAMISRIVAKSKVYLTQACGSAILAFGHAYGAFSAFGTMLDRYLARAEKDKLSPARAAEMLVKENLNADHLGVSDLMLKDPAAKRIFDRAEKLGVARRHIPFMTEVVKAAQKASRTPVDLDMLGGIGAAMMDLGFTPDAAWCIMAVTRSIAGGAHAIEEIEREGYHRTGQVLTPKGDYDGPADRPVPSLDERDRVARSGQARTPQEWRQKVDEGRKLYGSGHSIEEAIEDPRKIGSKKKAH